MKQHPSPNLNPISTSPNPTIVGLGEPKPVQLTDQRPLKQLEHKHKSNLPPHVLNLTEPWAQNLRAKIHAPFHLTKPPKTIQNLRAMAYIYMAGRGDVRWQLGGHYVIITGKEKTRRREESVTRMKEGDALLWLYMIYADTISPSLIGTKADGASLRQLNFLRINSICTGRHFFISIGLWGPNVPCH